MDEEVASILEAYGQNANDFGIVQTDNAYMLNSSSPPNYSDSFAFKSPGSVPLEHRNGAGGISWRQFRTTSGATSKGGQVGRSLTNAVFKQDLRKVIVACFIQNYDRLVHNQTGALREAVQQGTLDEQDGESYRFTFKIADLPGRARVSHSLHGGNTESQRPSTGFYGPIVFLGRGAIITPTKNMRFVFKGKAFSTHYVGPAAPRNIFEFTPEQIDEINKVVLEPITKDAKAWIKSMMEDKPDDGD
jgi:hypothetical protein